MPISLDWMPAGDGPLPFSKNLHDKLRPLCKQQEDNMLPPSFSRKERQRLERMCGQLREADKAGGRSSTKRNTFGGLYLVLFIISIALLSFRENLKIVIQNICFRKNVGKILGTGNNNQVEARAARLKRFNKKES